MKHFQTWVSALTLCLFLPLAPSQAGSKAKTVTLPVVDGTDIRFRRMSTADGLSQTRVAQIVQDDRGFIWFGTAYGLNRFDGYHFVVFVHDRQNPGSLSGVQTSALFKDRSGTLWVGCNHFLDRFNPIDETFIHYKLEVADRDNAAVTIFNINEDSEGKLWLSAGSKGLYRFDPATGKAIHYTHDPKDPASIGSTDVISTGQDRSGVFWVGHKTGLDRFDRTTGRVTLHIPLEDRSWLQFHEDRYGTLWLIYGADNTLATLDRQSAVVTRYPVKGEGLSENNLDSVFAMLEDREGVMWFATRRNGLLKLDRQGNRFIRYRNNSNDDTSLAADRLTTIFQDREGNFWIGLDEAPPNFFLSRPPLFENLTQATSLPGESARRTVVFKDHGGTLWLGSEKALWKIRRDTKQPPKPDPTLGSIVSIAEQQRDVLWLVGNFRGLIRLGGRSGDIKVYRPDPLNPNALNTNQVERILIAHDQTPWLATWDGLAKLDVANDRFTVYRNSLGSGYHTVVEDTSGILWLGSEQGLQRFDPASRQFTTYGNDPHNATTISDNRVASVFFDHAGVLWAATQNGLSRFDKRSGTFTSYSERDGLSGNVVSCILEDDRHVLWMSTNHGVSSLDPDRTTFRNYGIADGLPGLDFTGWGTCSRASDGEMFFSGYSGAVAFRPERTAIDAVAPQISLTGFRLFGAPVKMEPGSPLKQAITSSSAITLEHWQNFFSVEFAALSYYSPSTTRYRYLLEGVDPRWNEVAGSQRIASYTSVPPGVHTFLVQGATVRGPWSEPGIALRIEILPPWWRTWWFRLLWPLTAIAAAFTLYRLRVAQLTNQLNVRFEERVSERTRIARDLHDTMLQTIHASTMIVYAVRELPGLPAAAFPALDKLSGWLTRATDEARISLQSLRHAANADLAEELRSAGEESASGESVQFALTVAGRSRQLHPILHGEIYQIACEAIRNACRHSECSKVEVELKYARDLVLRVQDNGKGMPLKVVEKGKAGHFGLNGMRERATKIGARLSIRSSLGSGTEVELIVPDIIPVTRWLLFGNRAKPGASDGPIRGVEDRTD